MVKIILYRRLQSWTKISGGNRKKGTFLSSFIDHPPPSPYINIKFQLFHLTLTDGGRMGDLCYNYQFSPLFLFKIVDGFTLLILF